MKIIILVFLAFASTRIAESKIFSKCELVKKLESNFATDKLADWNCLVKHESSYNSSRRGPKNSNGSYDYGIFQINDKYWCKVGSAGGDCNADCNKFLDDDITDDIKCAQKIFRRHGFSAWYGWKNNCKGKTVASVAECL